MPYQPPCSPFLIYPIANTTDLATALTAALAAPLAAALAAILAAAFATVAGAGSFFVLGRAGRAECIM